MAGLPPSYQEVMQNPPSGIPSAPPLEYIATQPYNAQEQPAPPYDEIKDPRFTAWDDRATKILVVNRLDMNERFEKARNQLERHLLWNVILNHLLAAGYDFARIDVMQYWKHIFSVYMSIIDRLYAGVPIDTHWKYFEVMDSVFKYTTKRPTKTANEADSNTIAEILPSQPMFSIVHNGTHSEPLVMPHANENVVTTQPQSSQPQYTPTAPINNYNDDEDDHCCCCIGFCWCCPECCVDKVSRTSGYTSVTQRPTGRPEGCTYKTVNYGNRTGPYTRRTDNYTSQMNDDRYNTSTTTDNYYTDIISVNHINSINSGLTDDCGTDNIVDPHRHVSSHHTADHINSSTSGLTDDCRTDNTIDPHRHVSSHHTANHINSSTSGLTDDCRIDNAVDHHRHVSSHHTSSHNDVDSRTDGCRDTVGTSSHTDHYHSDTGGHSSYHHSDTGGGTDYGCSDTGGGTDYGCSDTGGGDDGGGNSGGCDD